MLRVALKYALIAGIFESILFHISRTMGVHPLTELSHLFFDVILLTLFISVAVYEYRRYHRDGILHFWEGMTLGFLVYTPSVLFFGLFLYIYFGLDPELLNEYKVLAMQILEERKSLYLEQFGQDQYDIQVAEIQQISVNRLIMSALLKKLIAGFFVTPALSIVLRKKA